MTGLQSPSLSSDAELSPILTPPASVPTSATSSSLNLAELHPQNSHYSILIEVKFGNFSFGAPIKIDARVVNNATGEVVRFAGVDFHSEGQDIDGNLHQILDATLDKEVEYDDLREKNVLNFTYNNAVVYGVDSIPESWPSYIQNTLQDLRKYLEEGRARLVVPFDPGQHESEMTDLLHHLNSPDEQRLFADYRLSESTIMEPITDWGEMADNYDEGHLKVQSPMITVPASYCFSSLEEAKLKLAHARYANYFWENAIAENLCLGSFQAAFVVAGPKAVLACIKRDYRGKRNPRAALDEHMTIIVSLPDSNPRKPPSGKITSNHVDVECDYAVLLHKVPNDIYGKATLVGSQPRFYEVEVEIDVNKLDAIRQVNGINAFFDRDSATYAKFWNVFLAQSSGALCKENFLVDKLGIQLSTIDYIVSQTAEKMQADGTPLNTEQLSILKKVGCSYSGWTLWRGPPGTGKSHTIALLIDVLLRFPGVGVLACAPSNGSVSRLYDAITKWFTRSGVTDRRRMPLRVFRKSLENQFIWSKFDPRGRKRQRMNEESRTKAALRYGPASVAGQWYKRQQEAEEQRVMDDPNNGVMAAVLQAIETGELYEDPEARIDKSEPPTEPSTKQQRYEQALKSIPVLRHYLPEATSIHAEELTRDKENSIRRCLDDVRTQIVGTRRLVVSTIGSATSDLIDPPFRDHPHVVVIIDEQSLDTDPGTLMLLTQVLQGSRPVQIILVGDENQGAPVIKSEQDNASFFGPQYALSTFERLIQAGIPCEALLEQFRMVSIIRQLPSDRCYDGLLRDSAEARNRVLSAVQRAALLDYFQVDFELVTLPAIEGFSVAQLQDQHLRHMMLNVRNGKAQVEKETKSRFNIGNIEVTLKLVKFLIEKKVVAPQEIVILVLYNAQKRRYIHRLPDLENELSLTNGELDGLIETSDSFQGREKDCAILDLVTNRYAGPGSMGHVSNERKMNVACSRARNFFYVVGTLDLLKGASLGDGPERMEYALELLTKLKRRGAYTNVSCTAQPKTEVGTVMEEDAEAEELTKGVKPKLETASSEDIDVKEVIKSIERLDF